MNEKVKTFIRDKIVSLKDDLQHYSMVEKDKVKERLLTLEIEDFDNVLGALNNLEELIKGKDEYIAKLCNDRAELKDKLKHYEIQNTILKEHEKELIAEQHRLFDLAKEQENELKELKDFTQIVFNKNVFIWGMAYRKKEVKDYKPTYEYYKNNCGYFHSGYKWELMTEKEFELVKKVVEKYGQEK